MRGGACGAVIVTDCVRVTLRPPLRVKLSRRLTVRCFFCFRRRCAAPLSLSGMVNVPARVTTLRTDAICGPALSAR